MQKHLLKKVLKKLNEAILNENPIIPKFDVEQERAYSRKKVILDKVGEYMKTSDTIAEYVQKLLGRKYKRYCIDTIRDIFLENYDKHDISISYQNGDEIEFTLVEYGAAVYYNTRTYTFTACYPIIIQFFPENNYLNVMTDIANHIYGELGIRKKERISVPDEELEENIMDDDMYWNSEVKLGLRLKKKDDIDTMNYLIKKIKAAQAREGSIE